MEKSGSSNVLGFIDRRLHPVRLSVSHLNRLLEGTRSGGMLNINRDLLLSITSTLELFVEDFELNYAPPSTEDKKTREKAPAEGPRITQSRVS